MIGFDFEFGPWNPGISSQLPSRLLGLSTIFRPEHVFTSIDHGRECRDFTGLALGELVIFRPERLVIHELLIRITADFTVSDGSRVEDLGINFRHMTDTIFIGYIAPRMDDIVGEYDGIKRALDAFITAELKLILDTPAARAPSTGAEQTTLGRVLALVSRVLGLKNARPPTENEWEKEDRVLRLWAEKAQAVEDPLQKAAYRALFKVISAVRIKYGRVWADLALLTSLATDLACNEYGSEEIGRLIEPYMQHGADNGEGFRLLPAQAAAGGDEHQGRLRRRQKHAAPAAARAGRAHRRQLAGFRADQPGHFPQVPARLRHAGPGLQICRRVQRPRTADRRPQARPHHGAQGRDAARCRTC